MNRPDYKFTVLIPTYNRTNFLERLLRYYHQQEFTPPFIIADGSPEPIRSQNASLIAQYNKLGMNLFHFIPPDDPSLNSVGSCQFGYMPRLYLAIQRIETPYVMMLCDDCLSSPEYMTEAAAVLDQDPTTATVHGDLWTFELEDRTQTRIYGPIKQLNVSAHDANLRDTAIERLLHQKQNVQLVWCMRRTSHVKEQMEIGHLARQALLNRYTPETPPGIGAEWVLESLCMNAGRFTSLINGKVRYVPYLMLAHQGHAENWGQKLKTTMRGDGSMLSPYWSVICDVFITEYSIRLASKAAISHEQAFSICSAILGEFLSTKVLRAAVDRLANFRNSTEFTPPSLRRKLAHSIPGLVRLVRSIRNLIAFAKDTPARRQRLQRENAVDLRFLKTFLETPPTP